MFSKHVIVFEHKTLKQVKNIPFKYFNPDSLGSLVKAFRNRRRLMTNQNVL